ncbi:hypothetical protein [Saccharibacillus kuerlensis]|uniref:Uncharacterized protein n=1 Tax=Saccharibacillus kuerlensis TaxID=459527 RepID=A0ABQ2L4S8_9BACL|nr:hypothetical protein [Saccharibacillus kuerlensis]GGO03375.1 hypothetical protein GCM10010969_27580 [Saccharibacillus kuerlensis]
MTVVVLFVVGVISAVLGSRLKHPVALIVNLLLIGTVFLLGYGMSIDPGSPSGNGNPALLLAIPLSVLGLLLIYQLYANRLLRLLHPAVLVAVFMGLLAHQAAGFELQHIRYHDLREEIVSAYIMAEQPVDWHRIENVTSGMDSMQMNSHFFHLNTYFLFIA